MQPRTADHSDGYRYVAPGELVLWSDLGMAYDDVRPVPPVASTYSTEERVGVFLRSVYGWMCAGLAFTAGTAWMVASSPSLVQMIFSSRFLMIGLVIAQFGLVITLSARAHRLAPGTASALFIGYSVLTGVTLLIMRRRRTLYRQQGELMCLVITATACRKFVGLAECRRRLIELRGCIKRNLRIASRCIQRQSRIVQRGVTRRIRCTA